MCDYEDDGWIDAEEEARQDEEGARYGDPRRCPRHPHIAISSPDGMFDGLCWECENAMEEDATSDRLENMRINPAPAAPRVKLEVGWSDDDIPF